MSGDKAITLGKLINTDDGSVLEHAIVVVHGERISYVGTDESQIPCGAERVDWSAFVGIPGLIDAHTHFAYQTDDKPGTLPWDRLNQLSPDEVAALARQAALTTLKTGVTSAIDKGAGASAALVKKLRDDIAAGIVSGPRLFVAGYGIPGLPTTPIATLTGWVEDDANSGADLIKIWADSCSGAKLTCAPNFTSDQLKACIDRAHQLGKRVAVHAYHEDTAKLAILAGADSLEHPDSFDSDDIAHMLANKTTYVPTIDHNRYYRDNASYFGYDTSAIGYFDSFIQLNLNALAAAHTSGVKIAMGSDAVFSDFGQNTRELGWLVAAGMTPLEALRASTINGAASIGAEQQIGKVAVGYYADLVAVDGDPLTDISVVINKVRAVMKGGALVTQ